MPIRATLNPGATPWPAAAARLWRYLVALLVALLASGPASAADLAGLLAKAAPPGAPDVDHSLWSALLKRYLVTGPDGISRVDYGAFRTADLATLRGYIAALEKVDPALLDRPGQLAFLANLYNAKTVEIVLGHYPVASIKGIALGGGLLAAFTGGPWKAKVVTLMGVALSLDDIESGLLRPVFKDARVHYALNCASLGCPNLNAEAFTAARLEAQLEAAARAYVNHPRGFAVSGGRVRASSIYKWYKEDFGSGEADILAHARRYAGPELLAGLGQATAIAGYDYDWSLNDAR